MYKEDVPVIKEYIQELGPDGVERLNAFVLSTIRTPFSRVKSQVKDITLKGSQSTALWGFKRAGYEYTLQNKNTLYKALSKSREEALEEFTKVPGLGITKASFALQCVGFDCACLDTHNLKLYNLHPSVTKKIDLYLKAAEIKTTEQWWDSWCNHIPKTHHNKSFISGEQVSKYHVECIKDEHLS